MQPEINRQSSIFQPAARAAFRAVFISMMKDATNRGAPKAVKYCP